MKLDFKDIQGLVVSSYKHLPWAAFLLLRIKTAAGARSWLSLHLPEITTSEGRKSEGSINIAFTGTGLKNLGLKDYICASFSTPFQEGMTTTHRTRILGDAGNNSPSHWAWGGPEKSVDVLLLMYAKDEDPLMTLLNAMRKHPTFLEAFDEVDLVRCERQPDNREHFGFRDGIGQPVMEGTGNKKRQLQRTHHATELPAGEFLLGYKNVYNVTADGPVVAEHDDPYNVLVPVGDEFTGLNKQQGMHYLGLNGTYLVLRQLSQDVAKFWQFVDAASRDENGNSNLRQRDELGAKLVGRWKGGAPLVLSPAENDPEMEEDNNFGYWTSDPMGWSCPVGSHIRRANPRDSLGPDPSTARDSANRHRILRRGRSYGPRIHNELVDDRVERGLIFIALNSDIERQFEFVQNTWLNNPVFAGLDGEVDPLVGNLPRGDCVFTIQRQPVRSRIHGLSQFVTVKGGAYFFLPSLKALKYLTTLESESNR